MVSDDDPRDLDGLGAPLPDAVVRYADHDDGLLDVHLPPRDRRAPARLVVLLHGGFWRQAYDRRHTRAAAASLAAQGLVVATPEYRRVGAGGGWPTTALDVEAAATAAPGLLSGLGVPTTGMTVVGHSAGGHLALWLATRQRVRAVVGLAPVCDLRAAARDRLGGAATQAFLGGEPDDVPDRYDAADPAVLLGAAPDCEIRIVHGSTDQDVPVAHSLRLAEARRQVSVRVLEGAGHFDLIDPRSAAWSAVLEALR